MGWAAGGFWPAGGLLWAPAVLRGADVLLRDTSCAPGCWLGFWALFGFGLALGCGLLRGGLGGVAPDCAGGFPGGAALGAELPF